jgi:hypothetical protein
MMILFFKNMSTVNNQRVNQEDKIWRYLQKMYKVLSQKQNLKFEE